MPDLISIITPTYNCGPFIEAAILSALRQTYANFEMIIVDDCSTDDTKQIVEPFLSDPRIRYEILETNSGAAVARTRAMELAVGSYMAFLDGDDVWLPQKLEKQLAFMKSNGYAFTCTAYEQIDGGGAPRSRIIRTKKRTNYNGLLLTCPVGNSSVMYDVRKMGKFAVPNIRKRNDDALWLQMLKKEEFIYGLDEILMQYRVRGNSISSNKLSLVKYHWKLYREIEHLSVFRSAFHIGFWAFLKVFRIK